MGKKWAILNLKTASTRINKEDYERLKVACWCEGYTIHRLLRSFIAWYLKREYGEKGITTSLEWADGLFLDLTTPSKHSGD